MAKQFSKFKWWKNSIRVLPWQKKWFIYLILLRPIIDTFYFLKELSILLSPLYLIGIITPILIFISLASVNIKTYSTPISFKIWSFFIFFNCTFLLINFPDVQMFGAVIKYTIPVFLIIYCWKFFRTQKDLELILYTAIIASIFPVLLLLFEFFVEPIKVDTLTESRGGGVRLEGLYADSVSYAIFFIYLMIGFAYYHMKQKLKIEKNYFTNQKVIIVLTILIIGLIAIKHTATWAVVLTIILLSFLSNLRNAKGFIGVVIFIAVFIPIVSQFLFEDHILPLIQKEIRVIQGNAPVENSFNGRMTRWIMFFEYWSKMNPFAQIIGVVHSKFEFARNMVTGFTHNDYIRQFFLTGIFGVISYVVFIIGSVRNIFNTDGAISFVILSNASLLLLYSISSMPSLYPTLLYLSIPVISFSYHLGYK